MRNDDITDFNSIDVIGIPVKAFKVFDKFMNHFLIFLLMLGRRQKLPSNCSRLLTEDGMSEVERLINHLSFV